MREYMGTLTGCGCCCGASFYSGAAGSTSDHFSIPVNRDDAKPKPFPPEEDADIIPLTKKVYNDMPPTLQKMSVMGKVVIVTG